MKRRTLAFLLTVTLGVSSITSCGVTGKQNEENKNKNSENIKHTFYIFRSRLPQRKTSAPPPPYITKMDHLTFTSLTYNIASQDYENYFP